MMKSFAIATLAALLAASPVGAQPGGRISLDARDTDLVDVIRLIGAESGVNLVPDSSIRPTKVTLRLRDVSFNEALSTLTTAYSLAIHREGRILILGDATSMNRRFADSGSDNSAQTIVVSLKNAKPDDVAAQLAAALPTGTVVVPDRRSGGVVITASPATILRARKLVEAFDAPAFGTNGSISTVAIPLKSQKPTEIVKVLRGSIADSAVYADDRSNSVIVTGNAEAIASARSILATVDVPIQQVILDVKVVEVRPNLDSSNVGFEFGGATFGASSQGGFVYSLVRATPQVNVQLNALITKGQASVLAQPRLATLNNHEAYMLVGTTYPVYVANLQTGLPTVQTIDVGVKLRLTPTIGADRSILADIHPEYSEIQGSIQAYPIVANRKIDSLLRVADGETIVLGGLFEDVSTETINKLPFLGDIPILGTFFRNRQTSRTRDQVVFMITPHII